MHIIISCQQHLLHRRLFFSKPGSLEELYIAPAKGLSNGTSDKTVEFLAGSFSNATAR